MRLLDRTRPRRHTGAVAALALTAVALAACGGGDALPDDPQAAVVQAASNAFDAGFTLHIGAEISDEVIDSAEAEDPEAAEGLRLLRDEPLSVALDDGALAITFRIDGAEFVALRVLEDAMYVRFDAEAGGSLLGPEELAGLEEVQGQLDAMGGPEGPFGPIAGVAQALFAGEWVGVTELPSSMTDELGALAPTDVTPEQALEQLRAAGLTDPEAFVERYLEVTGGEDGRYQASLRARDLMASFEQLATAFGEQVPDTGLEEVPERVPGFTIVTEGDRLASVEVDARALAEGVGETADLAELDAAGIGEGDAVLRLRVEDGADVAAPDEAETLTWSQIETLLQLAMSSMGGEVAG